MYSLTWIVVSLVMTISCAGGGHAHAYKALFVVGDSSVDTGNHDKVEPTLNRPWRPPYGITWPGHPSGRFSDGRAFTDFYAVSLNVTNPTPYRKIHSTLISTSGDDDVLKSFVEGGVNFAYEGSGVFPTYGSHYPTISTQINALKQLIIKGLVTPKLIRSSVALLSIFGNDYKVFLRSHSTKELRLFIPKVVSQIVASVEELYDMGFKTIIVANLQPIGCLPEIVHLNNNYTHCNKIYNSMLSVPHNTLLTSSMEALQNTYPNAEFTILDFYNAFEAALKGAKFPLRPCCEGIGGANCGDVDNNGWPLYIVCTFPKKAFFWDSYHLTDTAMLVISSHLQANKDKAFGSQILMK